MKKYTAFNMGNLKRRMFVFDIVYLLKGRSKVIDFIKSPSPSKLVDAKNKIAKLVKKLKKLKTPATLSGWYDSEGINYIADGIDFAKTPEFFVYNKGGDCDDYAEFAHTVLTKSGYKCNKLYLVNKEEAHVVLLATNKKSGRVFLMDNQMCFSSMKSIENACEIMLGSGWDGYVLIH